MFFNLLAASAYIVLMSEATQIHPLCTEKKICQLSSSNSEKLVSTQQTTQRQKLEDHNM